MRWRSGLADASVRSSVAMEKRSELIVASLSRLRPGVSMLAAGVWFGVLCRRVKSAPDKECWKYTGNDAGGVGPKGCLYADLKLKANVNGLEAATHGQRHPFTYGLPVHLSSRPSIKCARIAPAFLFWCL